MGRKKAFDEKAPFKWIIRDNGIMAAIDLKKGGYSCGSPFSCD